MNYLDLLPDDILQMINRKVKDDYIVKRRLERKANRRLNQEQKRNAQRREYISFRFFLFYRNYLRHKYMQKVKNHFERPFLEILIWNIYTENYRIREYKYSIIDLILEDFVIID